jgi:acyl-CoA thioesterase
MLYAHESTHAGRGLSYSRAQIFTQSGRLVASFSQESMIRGLAEAARGMGPATAL